MVVVKVVDQDVADKVDTEYIRNEFAHLQNIGMVFICTREGGEEDDWIDESGVRNIVILLPYKEVKKVRNIRPLMLMRAKIRLGLVA